MRQQTADVVASHLRELRVAFGIIEERLAFLPQTLVRMHTRTIITEDWLGHERSRLTVLARRVLDNIFVEHHIVGGLCQRVKTNIDFRLSCRAHFMVLGLNGNADFF